jgi:RimJ/RimL family protein N-acetyltransferase
MNIRIRRYLSSDIDAVYEAVVDSKAQLEPWMPWCHADYSRDDTAQWVLGREQAWNRKEEFGFVIESGDGRLLGTCGIKRFEWMNRCAELGYWVRTSATGQGIATTATRQLCQWAFEEAGLHRVEVLASVENPASIRVAEKAGAIREGILRQRLLLHGRWHDCVLSAVINHASFV